MDYVTEAIERLRAALGERSVVSSVALYGSYVRGGYRANVSDINIAVVVNGNALTGVAPALRDAWRAARIDPWIARIEELAVLTDVFATRVRDIQRHHRMLLGDDPWNALVVPRAALRLRIEQELRNHQMRLRHAEVLSDTTGHVRQLHATATALRVDLELLAELGTADLPRDDVATILEHRFHDVPAALAAAHRVVDRAVSFIDQLEVT